MPTKKEKGEAVSNSRSTATETGKDASALIAAIEKTEAPEVAPDTKEPEALVLSQLSQQTVDLMTQELRTALHQIEKGFGELTAPGKIFEMDQPFYVVDAFTIPDYVDQTSGEEKIKHVFTLEFDGGVVRNTMQSDARPRRVLAKAFMLVNQLGGRLRIGPYKYEKKPIPRQIQPAFIFVQQPGFKQEAHNN